MMGFMSKAYFLGINGLGNTQDVGSSPTIIHNKKKHIR